MPGYRELFPGDRYILKNVALKESLLQKIYDTMFQDKSKIRNMLRNNQHIDTTFVRTAF